MALTARNPRLTAAIVLSAVSLIASNRQLTSFIFQFAAVPTTPATVIVSNRPPSDDDPSVERRPTHRVIPLLELVNTNKDVHCKPPLIRINDTIAPDLHVDYTSHRIPKIVHVTARSRCMTKVFADVLDRWRFDGWSFFLHDDEAMDRLLNQYWPMFPQVSESVKCMISGASKADIWRGLVLWEYGGVYTDIDNSPNKFNGNFLTNEDSLFVVEMLGVLSQYFMAASPRHPLMHQLILSVTHKLYSLSEVSKQYAPTTTGPGALKHAFIQFMGAMSTWDGWSLENPVGGLYNRVTNGTYVGLGNRSVTVVGRKERNQEYVVRDRIRGAKKLNSYAKMGMTHFNVAEKKRVARNESCLNRLYNEIDWSVYAYDERNVSGEEKELRQS